MPIAYGTDMSTTPRLLTACTAAFLLAACGDRSASDASVDDPDGTTRRDAGGDVAQPVSLEGLAFAIEIPRDDTGQGWCNGDCVPATALVKKIDGATMQLVWGATGRATVLTLIGSGSSWKLDESLQLGSRKESHVMCLNDTQLGPATFDFADQDGDGAPDLRISGHQLSMHCGDDYRSSSSSDVTLLGRPMSRLSNMVVPAAGFEPVHGASIDMDAPLEPTATASLVPEDGSAAIALTPRAMAGYVVGFDTDAVLPLGGRYAVEIAGKDFAEFGTPPSATLEVLDEFGVLAEDGFESGATAGIHGGTIVDDFHAIPALHGSRMLYVAPGQPALLRLRRKANEASVVMDVRKISDCFGAFAEGAMAIDVAIVGGPRVQSAAVTLGDDPATVPPGDAGGGALLGELQTVTLPLDADGEDVLVYFLGESYQGSGCARAGALIDDVTLK